MCGYEVSLVVSDTVCTFVVVVCVRLSDHMASSHSCSPPHDPVHDSVGQEETVVNPGEPSGHAGRSAAPNTGNKTSKPTVNYGNLDDSLQQMFK